MFEKKDMEKGESHRNLLLLAAKISEISINSTDIRFQQSLPFFATFGDRQPLGCIFPAGKSHCFLGAAGPPAIRSVEGRGGRGSMVYLCKKRRFSVAILYFKLPPGHEL